MATDDERCCGSGCGRNRPCCDIGKPAAARQPAAETPEDAGPESSALDDFASLPQPGSPYDAAYSRASNKPVPTLRFIIGDTIRGLPYANYDGWNRTGANDYAAFRGFLASLRR